MEIEAETYNNINGPQLRDANETLERIKKDGVTRASIILDVGCGSGNITKLMGSRIPHERIIALDIDPEMIDFAKKHNTDSSIEFLVQDIGVPFEQLDEKIQKLENQVDLIWSNRVLHWVPEEQRLQAMKNLYRLAKPGAPCYVKTTLTVDFNSFLPEAQKLENEKVIKLPSEGAQLQGWMSNFTDAGFKNLEIDIVRRNWDWGKGIIHIAPFVCSLRRYLRKDLTDKEKDEILKGFQDLFLRSLAQPMGQPIVESTEGLTVTYYTLFQIVCSKQKLE